jgi:hypothetical protein
MRGRTRGGQRVTSKVQRVREGSPSAIENARARATREGSAALCCSAAARGRRPRTRTRHATRTLRKQRAGMEEEEVRVRYCGWAEGNKQQTSGPASGAAMESALVFCPSPGRTGREGNGGLRSAVTPQL